MTRFHVWFYYEFNGWTYIALKIKPGLYIIAR